MSGDTTSATMNNNLIDEDAPSEDELLLNVPIHLIDVPDDWRVITPQAIEEMAESIREVGLLQPVGVVATEGSRYTLCFGATRVLATEVLHHHTIKARVLVVEDDEHRRVITDVENIRRTRLQPAEEVRAIGRWRDWYLKKHPESQMSGDHFAKTQGSTPKAPVPIPDKTPGFTRQAASRIGQSTRSVKYSLQIRKKIPDEYLQEFAKKQVSRTDLIKIASIEPEEDRLGVCNLFGILGVPLEEAIQDVTAPPGQTVEHKQTRAVPPDVPPLQQLPEEELSDEEWYQSHCRDVDKRLTDPLRYREDAILYRQLRDARDEFRARTKRLLAQSRRGRRGPFHYLACRLVNVDHPSTWLVCGSCAGTGMNRLMSDCQSCHGHGYMLTTVSVKREKQT